MPPFTQVWLLLLLLSPKIPSVQPAASGSSLLSSVAALPLFSLLRFFEKGGVNFGFIGAKLKILESGGSVVLTLVDIMSGTSRWD